MRMGIRKARAKRCLAKIDQSGRSGDRQIASHINNFVALHNEHTVLHETVRLTVEQSRSFQCDYFVSGARRQRQQESCNYTTRDFHTVRLEATREPGKRRGVNMKLCYGFRSFAVLSASPCCASGRFGSSANACLKATMARSW